MVWPCVLLGDAEVSESGFELVAAAPVASEPGRVHEAVVGEHRWRDFVSFSGFVEGVDHDVTRDASVA